MKLLQNLIELIDSPAHRGQGSTTAICNIAGENDIIIVANEYQRRDLFENQRGLPYNTKVFTLGDILNYADRGCKGGRLFFDNCALGSIFREVAVKISVLEDERDTFQFELNRTAREKDLLSCQKHTLENELKVANFKIQILEQKCQEYESDYIADTKISDEASERIEELTEECAEYRGKIKELEEKIKSLDGEPKKTPLSYWQIEIYGAKELARIDTTGNRLYITGCESPYLCSEVKFIKQIDLV